jgi:hypothetical protein
MPPLNVRRWGFILAGVGLGLSLQASASEDSTFLKDIFPVRSVDPRRFDEEINEVYKVYTEAWEENWGAVAMTRKEFDYLVAQFKGAGDLDLFLIATVGGEMAGFSLALPDFNQVLIRLNGRLFPFGILKPLA